MKVRYHWGGWFVCKMGRESLTEEAVCELRLERAGGTRVLQARVPIPPQILRWECTWVSEEAWGDHSGMRGTQQKMRFRNDRRETLCLDFFYHHPHHLTVPTVTTSYWIPAGTQQRTGHNPCIPETQTLQSGQLRDNVIFAANGLSTDLKGVQRWTENTA